MPDSDVDRLSQFPHSLLIEKESPTWSELPLDVDALAYQAARAVLTSDLPPYEVSIIFGDDALLRQLNHQYRGIDKPTNVLSFESGARQHPETFPPVPHLPLGDIMLSYETIAQEAITQGKTFQNHLIHLLCHGLLHLLGYDHVTAPEAEVMETMEIQILAKMGIPNPYVLESAHDF